jgi:radical SAM superfamily enzyme YgiQ (UPF0313 family)
MIHGVILTDAVFDERIRPLGAYTIADTLRKAGYEIQVLDYVSRLPLDQLFALLDIIITDDTLFLGYSTTLFHSKKNHKVPFDNGDDDFVAINQHIKNRYPNIKIIVGGSNSNVILEQLVKIRETYTDYVVLGYAESMMLDLVNSLANDTEPYYDYKVNGAYVISYDLRGKLYDYKHSTHFWHDSDFIIEGECLPLEVARGCIFRCTFCTFPLIGMHKQDTSYIRLEDSLYSELLYNYEKFNTTTYMIVDDTFNERNDKIELLLRARDRTKLDLNFVGYTRLDLLAKKPEQISLLKDLNFNGHYFGVETLNEKTAKAIGKYAPAEELFETMHKLKNAFNNKVNLMLGYIVGLPYETPETVDYWINRLIEDDSPVDCVGLSPLWMSESAFGKSSLYANPEKYGYRLTNDPFWENDVWDYHKCAEIANHYNLFLYDSGKLKIPSFSIAGYLRFGLKFDDLIDMPLKTFDETIKPNIPELKVKIEQEYFSKIKKLYS